MGFRTQTYEGQLHYQCDDCPNYDTFELPKMEEHQATVHPSRPASPAEAIDALTDAVKTGAREGKASSSKSPERPARPTDERGE